MFLYSAPHWYVKRATPHRLQVRLRAEELDARTPQCNSKQFLDEHWQPSVNDEKPIAQPNPDGIGKTTIRSKKPLYSPQDDHA